MVSGVSIVAVDANIANQPNFSLRKLVGTKKSTIFAARKKNNKMYFTSKIKKEIIKKHGKSDKDTGLSEVQVALFTKRIDYLTGHLKKSPKDTGTHKSLIDLVGKRRRLLDYLKNNDIERYRAVIKTLDIRK